MKLAMLIGKYALVVSGLGSSAVVPLFYATTGEFVAGGGNQTINNRSSMQSATKSESEETFKLVSSDTIQQVVPPSIAKHEIINYSDQQMEARHHKSNKVDIELREIPEKRQPSKVGQESQKLSQEKANSIVAPLLKSLETPMYYRGNLNFINSVRFSLPKNIVSNPSQYGINESKEDLKDRYSLYLNRESNYTDYSRMFYSEANDSEKFKSLANMSKYGFEDWNSSSNIESKDFSDFYYEIIQDREKSRADLIFGKYFKNEGYTFELEYVFDGVYRGPILQVGYVGYKDTNWWKGAYYQAEGGSGYQRHIGAVKSSYANANSPINKDFVESFSGTDISKFVKWGKIFSDCAEDYYCKLTLSAPRSAQDFVELPEDKYKSIEKDKGYDGFHPLYQKWANLDSSKLELSNLKNINTLRRTQR